MKDETWVDVDGFEGLYMVSDLGRVKSLAREVVYGDRVRHIKDRIIKPSKRLDGYLIVGLFKDGGRTIYNLHRLIAETLIPNPDPSTKCDVDHIDGNKENNSIDNLRWATRRENLANRKTKKKGCRSPVRCITTGEEFPTIEEASNKYDIKRADIRNCCKGHTRTTKSNIEDYDRLEWEYITLYKL